MLSVQIGTLPAGALILSVNTNVETALVGTAPTASTSARTARRRRHRRRHRADGGHGWSRRRWRRWSTRWRPTPTCGPASAGTPTAGDAYVSVQFVKPVVVMAKLTWLGTEDYGRGKPLSLVALGTACLSRRRAVEVTDEWMISKARGNRFSGGGKWLTAVQSPQPATEFDPAEPEMLDESPADANEPWPATRRLTTRPKKSPSGQTPRPPAANEGQR